MPDAMGLTSGEGMVRGANRHGDMRVSTRDENAARKDHGLQIDGDVGIDSPVPPATPACDGWGLALKMSKMPLWFSKNALDIWAQGKQVRRCRHVFQETRFVSEI